MCFLSFLNKYFFKIQIKAVIYFITNLTQEI